MPAPINLGFELPGTTPGSALGWVVTVTDTYEEWAGFGGVLNLSAEGFEVGWNNDSYEFAFQGVGTDLEAAAITTDYVTQASVEDFETRWSNSGFLFALSNVQASSASPDDFETGWNNNAWSNVLTSVAASGASPDNFETGWQNSSYITSLGATDTALINRPGGTDTAEGFEYFLEDLEIASFSQNTPTITLVGTRNFSDGDFLYLVLHDDTGGEIPAPFGTGTRYIVHVLTASTFELSIVNVIGPFLGPSTSAGVGPWFTRPAPTLYWTGEGPGV